MDQYVKTGAQKLKGNEALNFLIRNPEAKANIVSNTSNIDIGKLRNEALTSLSKQREIADRQNKIKQRGAILGGGPIGDIVYDIGKSLTAFPRAQAAVFSDTVSKKVLPGIVDLAGNKQLSAQARQVFNQNNKTLQNLALDPEEQQRLKNEGAGLFLGQGALNSGSFFVPVGGAGTGIAKTLALGGGVGAAQSLANQDLSKGVDVDSVIKNAILGAGTAGTFKLAGNVVNKLRGGNKVPGVVDDVIGKKSNAFEKANLNIKPDASPLGLAGAENLADDASRYISNRGFNVTAKNVGNAYSKAVGELDDVLAKSTARVPVGQAVNKMDEILAREGVNIADKGTKEAYNWVLNKATQLGDDAPASLVAKLKSELDNTLGAVYKKLDNPNAGPITPAEQIRLSFRESLDDVLKTAVPESAPLYRELSTYHQVAGGANKAAQSSISAPFFIGGVKLPAGGAIQNIRGAAGNLVRNGPSLPGIKLPSQVGQVLNSPYAKTPVIAGMDQNRTVGGLPTQLDDSGVNSIINNYISGQSNDLSGLSQQRSPDKTQILMQALQLTRSPSKPNGDIAQAIALANYLGADQKTKPLTATQQQDLRRAEFGLAGLDTAKQLLSNNNLFGLAAQGSLPDFIRSPEGRQFNTAINQMVEAMGRLQSGGAISDVEFANFRNQLPSAFDDPGTLQNKFAAVEQLFNSAAGRIQSDGTNI